MMETGFGPLAFTAGLSLPRRQRRGRRSGKTMKTRMMRLKWEMRMIREEQEGIKEEHKEIKKKMEKVGGECAKVREEMSLQSTQTKQRLGLLMVQILESPNINRPAFQLILSLRQLMQKMI